ncbi:MAG: esterase-like of phytase family protein [Alphaproteobacteria bacterium]|nr:esterase-like of phytase family protein [Alphaproteobacteria bacterium]
MRMSANVNAAEGWQERPAPLEAAAMRFLACLACLVLLATFAPPGTRGRPEPLPAVAFVHFAPVPFDDSDPKRRRIGPLTWLGEWKLTSNDRRFGGISAMEVEGDRVTSFSDAGWLIRFQLPHAGAVAPASVGPLPQGPGDGERKSDRDIESMILSGDSAWIGLERRNAIWRYDRSDWHVTSWAAPRPMRHWPANRGAEAMLRLGDGRFLVFAEGQGVDSLSHVLLFAGDPSVPGTPFVAMHYAKPPGYRTTDAAQLPDGRILILNRRFALLEGVSAKLSLLDLSGAREGAVLRGRVLADFHRPLNVDNMEGLSITRERGRTIVWIASDDNYNPLQRTLLMKFALDDRL